MIFTPCDTTKKIKDSKNSKAMGPDDISPIMIKNLGQNGINFMTNMFNKVVNNCTIPPIWKVGRIIPLPKPGKPSDEGPSYRPISLLSPAAKILESLLLEPLQDSISLKPHQHGFRKGRSTVTALQDITGHIRDGLNKKKPVDRTVMVAIDLSRAFDTVNHELLIQDVLLLPLNNRIKRFIAAYLRGRQTFVEFRGAKSSYRKMKQGVLQGGVLSPTLFNLYMKDMPTPSNNICLVTYADDSTGLNSGPKIEPLCEELNEYLDVLNSWFTSRNLFISPSKSSATLFTTFSNEASLDLPIFINGEKVPTKKDPVILGVTLDPLLSFKTHTTKLKDKVNKRNNVLKALAGSSWGKEKETLLTTFKATSQSLLNYCAPIWSPGLSDTNWRELQAAQNSALRTATGCVKMTDQDHLHTETKTMPVESHCNMLTKQFCLATYRPDHPNHKPDIKDPPRKMRQTIYTKHHDQIKHMIPHGGMDMPSYKSGLNRIHTLSVEDVIRNCNPNKILSGPAPPVNKEELQLPRQSRVALSQLRSGYSSQLNSYLNIINLVKYNDPSCPKCNQAPHTTSHLFSCTATPTDLTTRSLWEEPTKAAIHLGLPTRDGVG